MSALGQKRTSHQARVMSALPPKEDITERDRHVRFVPKADIHGDKDCRRNHPPPNRVIFGAGEFGTVSEQQSTNLHFVIIAMLLIVGMFRVTEGKSFAASRD